jgi:hypothetical protein
MRDLAYILRDRARRADADCTECGGSGNDYGDEERPCSCVAETVDDGVPDPRADEGQSDAREISRCW